MKIDEAKRVFTGGGLAALALAGLASGGCSSSVYTHGNQLDPASLAKVEPGKTRLLEVQALFGRPSATGAFGSGRVYYVAQIMEEAPGGRKETVSRTLVAFSYNDTGVVTAIDITDEQSGRSIYHRDEKTPTPGDTFGVLEQVFRNVRRAGGQSGRRR